MKSLFKEYFYHTRSERNGTIGIITLILCILIFPYLHSFFSISSNTDYKNYKAEIARFRQIQLKQQQANLLDTSNVVVELFEFDPNTANKVELTKLGLPKRVVNTIDNYRKKGGRFFKVADLKKIYGLQSQDFERLKPYVNIKQTAYKQAAPSKTALFTFDPNTISFDDLKRLGLSTRTAKAIVNYRNKGGHFRIKEDLQKIYTLDTAMYTQLEAYIKISLQKAAQDEQQLAFREANTRDSARIDEHSSFSIDINRATSEEWQQLRGIGSGYSRRIIQFRVALGGFTTINQLSETYGLPDSVFQRIKPYLTESPILSYIQINTVTEEELAKHPYISWKQAKLLVNYRTQHGIYSSIEDVKKIRALQQDAIARFAPYLDFLLDE